MIEYPTYLMYLEKIILVEDQCLKTLQWMSLNALNNLNLLEAEIRFSEKLEISLNDLLFFF